MLEMSNRVETAERMIQDPSPGELTEFTSWFTAFQVESWDADIERDSQAGGPFSHVLLMPNVLVRGG